MGYVNYSIYLPDPKFLKRVGAVAKKQKVSIGAFIRSAAERAVEAHEASPEAANENRDSIIEALENALKLARQL